MTSPSRATRSIRRPRVGKWRWSTSRVVSRRWSTLSSLEAAAYAREKASSGAS
jgi:hypothetical protein